MCLRFSTFISNPFGGLLWSGCILDVDVGGKMIAVSRFTSHFGGPGRYTIEMKNTLVESWLLFGEWTNLHTQPLFQIRLQRPSFF